MLQSIWRRSVVALITLSTLFLSRTASATNGYFDIGYGAESKGAGGVGVALPQDSLATAANPAGEAFVGNRFDLGATYFVPYRGATLGPDSYDGDNTASFIIPNISAAASIGDDWALGIAVYGNGGLDTQYNSPIPAFGTKNPGVDLEQVYITPTLAYKFGDGTQSIGISPVIAYQQFKAYGLENFGVPDAGWDLSYGGGARIGYLGKFFNDFLSLGATYQTRIYSTRFHDYSGLFAGHGNFDIPSNFAGGVALKILPPVTLAFDAERILYSEIKSVGNELNGQTFQNGLGSNDGPGFGWRDITVLKAGVVYNVTNSLTLRAGYNYNTQPIRRDQTFFNILAPAVVQHHVTAGLTLHVNKSVDLSAFYLHAFEENVKGENNFNNGNANLHMSQDAVGVSLGFNF